MYIETPGDFSIKFEGCYALAKLDDDPNKYAPIVKISDSFNTDGNGLVVSAIVTRFYRNSSNQTRASSGHTLKIDEIDLKPLRLGAINLKKSVVVLKSTIPKGNTKYRKLPCDGNTIMYDPFSKEREYLELIQPKSFRDYFILNAWGNREFLPATEALEEVVGHNRLGAAFNPVYFFGISHAGDGVFLYKNGYRIARINSMKEIVLKPVVHPLAEQLAEFGLKVKKVGK